MAMNLCSDRDKDDAEAMVDINTTPLIDVMLVLMIMLIITIPMQTQSVDLHLPTTAVEQPAAPPQIISVSLDATGAVLWNGQVVGDGQGLETLLRGVAQQSDQPEIHLQADRRTAYKHLAGVLAAAQRSGVRKIGIVQEEGE